MEFKAFQFFASGFPPRSIYRLFLATILVLISAGPVRAAGAGVGIAAVEEGDDRMRPAAMLSANFPGPYFARLYYYGRSYADVKQQTELLTGGFRFRLFGARFLYGSLGGTVMNEFTSIGQRSASGDKNVSENAFNLGAAFGLDCVWETDWTSIGLGWESHLFLAGEGGLLLANGRKQMLSISAGFRM